MKTILIICLLTTLLTAQTIYELPFASKGNIIELSLSNESPSEDFTGKVELLSAPDFIKFKNSSVEIEKLVKEESASACFEFDVTNSAAVNKETDLVFTVKSDYGEQWTKTITVSVSPPEEYELFQNYPNPFNPSTIISYLLPEESKVSVQIFNVLGERVADFPAELKTAGQHEVLWDASYFASGTYICLVRMENTKGETKQFQKKMMLVK